MLKPVSKQEKLDFTLKMQAEKATNEILDELLSQNYIGFVDIVFDLKHAKNMVKLEVTTKKVPHLRTPRTPSSIRYEVLAGAARLIE